MGDFERLEEQYPAQPGAELVNFFAARGRAAMARAKAEVEQERERREAADAAEAHGETAGAEAAGPPTEFSIEHRARACSFDASLRMLGGRAGGYMEVPGKVANRPDRTGSGQTTNAPYLEKSTRLPTSPA